jgi:glycosyltransferase involved in cell wall biosynthesis
MSQPIPSRDRAPASEGRRAGLPRLRIAQVAPLFEPVPPPAYGGTELIVHLVTEELVRRGHEVTLFASGDSKTAARLEAGTPVAFWSAEGRQRFSDSERERLGRIHHARPYEESRRFDIVHEHGDLAGLEAAVGHDAEAVLVTHHRKFEAPMRPLLERFRGRHNAVSAAAALTYPTAGQVDPVHHGIDVLSFPFRERHEGYLLFLGRMAAIKGPDTAVRVAKRTGRRLVLAGRVHPQDRDDFERDVAPLIDGGRVRYVGEADAAEKRRLLAGAEALLFPIRWEEPFGLVMIEALSCGTPVVATRRASTPEVVEDGVTGLLSGSGDGSEADVVALIEALELVGGISRLACRRAAESRFTVERMVDAYEDRYARLLGLAPDASAEAEVVDGDLVGEPRPA